MPVRTTFGGLAPHRLLRRLIAGPPRADEAYERDLTVMFTDIAGFTELAESLSPSAVAELLRGHLGALAERIEDERGVVDKVLGDGLLAFWEHGLARCPAAAPAVRAARRSGPRWSGTTAPAPRAGWHRSASGSGSMPAG